MTAQKRRAISGRRRKNGPANAAARRKRYTAPEIIRRGVLHPVDADAMTSLPKK